MRKALLIIFLMLSVLTVLALAVTFYGLSAGYWSALPGFMWPTTLGLLVITVSVHALSLHLADSRPQEFVQFFLLIMVVKLLIYMIYNLVMILNEPREALANVIFFFSLYISFTLVETLFMFNKIAGKQHVEEVKKNF